MNTSKEPAQEQDWADCMEQAVLDAAVERAPALGWNGRMVRAACAGEGLLPAPPPRR